MCPKETLIQVQKPEKQLTLPVTLFTLGLRLNRWSHIYGRKIEINKKLVEKTASNRIKQTFCLK